LAKQFDCLANDARNNSWMQWKLQARAGVLLESLLISECEMRCSRTIGKKLEAFRDFHRVVDGMDDLRRDAEMLKQHEKNSLLDNLDGVAVRVMRSMPYQTIEWIATADLTWFIANGASQSQAC